MHPEIQSRDGKREKKPINGNAVPASLVEGVSAGNVGKSEARFTLAPDKVHALMGWYETPAELYKACEALRDAGYQRFDAHTPFAVHGLEHAMGLRPSRLPWIVLGGGLFGLLGSIALAWYTQGVDYPQNISGKEAFSFQAYVPVFFELTVLCAAFAAFFGMWGMNKLPRFFHPVQTHPSFHRSTDDAFFISVEAADPKYDRVATKKLLTALGTRELFEVAS
jgi:hypothetical protein